MTEPTVSIIIPHYQTADLAKLCLRSIRHYTCDVPYEVIVIDNGSKDGASIEYLRQVQWIRLIERTEDIGYLGLGHKEAIDIGIDASRAPFVLAFHTDTIPVREDWLSWHLEQFNQDPKVAAVGTYKLEIKSRLWWMLKRLDRFVPRNKRRRGDQGDDRPYVRSHCALYRRDVLRELGLRYNDPDDDVAGRYVHYALEEAGYDVRLLDVAETLKRVVHLNHGTKIVLPELGARRRTIRSGRRRIDRFLKRDDVRVVLDRQEGVEQGF